MEESILYKRQRKPKGQSKMDISETLVTLGTQGAVKKKHNTEN